MLFLTVFSLAKSDTNPHLQADRALKISHWHISVFLTHARVWILSRVNWYSSLENHSVKKGDSPFFSLAVIKTNTGVFFFRFMFFNLWSFLLFVMCLHDVGFIFELDFGFWSVLVSRLLDLDWIWLFFIIILSFCLVC